jgi:hypothetical protein
MSPDDLIDLGKFFEVSSLPNTRLADVDPLKWNYYYRELRDLDEELDPSRLLYNLQFMNTEGALTVVGNLFFGRQPSRTLPRLVLSSTPLRVTTSPPLCSIVSPSPKPSQNLSRPA